MSLGTVNSVVTSRLLACGIISSSYQGAVAISGHNVSQVLQSAENYIEGNEAFGNGIQNDLITNKYLVSKTDGGTYLYQGTGEHQGEYTSIDFYGGHYTQQDEYTTANQLINGAVTYSNGTKDTSGYVKNYSSLQFGMGTAKMYYFQDAGTDSDAEYEPISLSDSKWEGATFNAVNINTNYWNSSNYSKGLTGSSDTAKASYTAFTALLGDLGDLDKTVLSQYTEGSTEWYDAAFKLLKSTGNIYNVS